MKILKIIFFLLVLFFAAPLIYAQVEDDSKLVKIETMDGNEFVGTISSEDSETLVLKTKNLGKIKILRKDIKTQVNVNEEQLKDGVLWTENPQETRYFWAPNAYGLRKGEGYYQNIYVFWNQASYGLTDKITIGGGIIPTFLFGAATPVFLTPKISIPIVKDKLNIGGGMLLGTVIGDVPDDVSFGIAYGLSTFGSRDSNISISLGYGYAGGDWANSPLINISGMKRTSRRFYLLTENYYIKANNEGFAVISVGGRWIMKKAALDFLLFRPFAKDLDMGNFIAVPLLGITIPFG